MNAVSIDTHALLFGARNNQSLILAVFFMDLVAQPAVHNEMARLIAVVSLFEYSQVEYSVTRA